MNKNNILLLLMVGFVVVIGGAYALYNNLTSMAPGENMIVTQEAAEPAGINEENTEQRIDATLPEVTETTEEAKVEDEEA